MAKIDPSARIEIVKDDFWKGYYAVMLFDDNGMSALAKTKYKTTAIVFARKFREKLNKGIPLREDKSVWQ